MFQNSRSLKGSRLFESGMVMTATSQEIMDAQAKVNGLSRDALDETFSDTSGAQHVSNVMSRQPIFQAHRQLVLERMA